MSPCDMLRPDLSDDGASETGAVTQSPARELLPRLGRLHRLRTWSDLWVAAAVVLVKKDAALALRPCRCADVAVCIGLMDGGSRLKTASPTDEMRQIR